VWQAGGVEERRFELPARYDLAGTLAPISLSRHDRCARWAGGTFWLAARTPDGPASLALRRTDSELTAHTYGPGAGWLIERADAIAGLRDDMSGFAELARRHDLVARLAGAHSGLRLTATGLLYHRLLRAICEQKVTGKEAYGAYASIVRHFGEPAPAGPDSPPELLLPPDPVRVAATPYHDFHPLGLEQRRTNTLRGASARIAALQASPDSATLQQRLQALPGIGVWTAAEVGSTVMGDPDAVSVGDYHLKNVVSWALAGEPRGTDERMLQLLAPFAGQRGRVCQLLIAAGIGAPRYGPRLSVRGYRKF
jgi:3-methyladenine DNA glycosylase/8-oxoguanine DNA glycosylase